MIMMRIVIIKKIRDKNIKRHDNDNDYDNFN